MSRKMLPVDELAAAAAQEGVILSDRRRLLKGALLSGGVVAAAAIDGPLNAKAPSSERAAPAAPGIQEFAPPAPNEPGLFVDHPASDVMVDIIKSLGIEYVAANPGSSFRGLHESIINYGNNQSPELLTCLHEETSVAIAAGYARATGKPMAVMLHATVGVQHGAMSIYHAFVDCVPVLIFSGASLDAETRRPYIEWVHAAQDNASTVRDFLKWDDQPHSLQHFAESTVRGMKLATDVPMGPVMIMIDDDLQEKALTKGTDIRIPKLSRSVPPVGDSAAIDSLADALIAANDPVLLAHRYARTTAGFARLIELAELLQIPVVDSGDRCNFPTDHPLCHSERVRSLVAQADVVLALEPVDLWGALNRLRDQNGSPTSAVSQPSVRIFTIGTADLSLKSNYQNFQRYVGATLAIEGDAEATLPSLITALKARLSPDAGLRIAERGERLKSLHEATRRRNQEEARFAWDVRPITTGRLCLEIRDAIGDNDWVLANQTNSVSAWPQKLWNFNKPHHYAGSIGAGGVGSSIGTATGVALGHRGSGRIVINIQNDGDLLYAPGALWTAVHHKIPMLNVVHNNRSYHQEVMHIQRMASRRDRGIDRSNIGTAIDDPPVSFVKLAESMGMWALGPITDPSDLSSALKQAVEEVQAGRPALVEVITQPR